MDKEILQLEKDLFKYEKISEKLNKRPCCFSAGFLFFWTIVKKFIFLDLYQNDIFSDLANAFPGDHKFTIPAKQTAELAGPGYNESGQHAGMAVKFHIRGTSQTAAGAGVDDFLLF